MMRLSSCPLFDHLKCVYWLLAINLLLVAPLAVAQDRSTAGLDEQAVSNVEGGEIAPRTGESGKESAVTDDMISVGVNPAGVQRHVSGKWATLAVNGTNRSDKDAEEVVIFSLGGDSNVQVSRKVWLPAGARRQAWFPVLIPDTAPDQLQISGQTIQVAATENGETFKSNPVGSPTSKRSLLLSPPEDEQVGMLLDSIITVDASEFDARPITDMIYAGFDSATDVRQDLGIVRLANHFFPTTAKPLDSLDNLIIASDRAMHDTVGVARIRQWLNDGGRIWLMADRVSPESVRQLLGDAVNYSVLGRVQLNDFTIEKLDPFFSTVSLEEKWSSETPVELLRVTTDVGEVHSQIDGWPTAFWVPSGNGEILVTTLSHQGWMFNGNPTESYRDFASRFFAEKERRADYRELVSKELQSEIGYTIPSRSLIGILLGGQLLLFAIAGIYFSKTQTLHRLGWFLPVSVMASVFIMLAFGAANTSAVPSTIAIGQLARVRSETSQILIDTSVAIYSQETEDLPLDFDSDTVTELDNDWEDTSIRRQQYLDDGTGGWQFLKQPPGRVQHLHATTQKTIEVPWELRGTFNQQGFIGKLKGMDFKQASDSVVVSKTSPSMTIVGGLDDNRFVGANDQVLLPDQFYDGSLLTERQRKRQEFIRELIELDPTFLPAKPSLLTWTPPITNSFGLPDPFEQRGWALAIFPIDIETPKAGQSFAIPSSFIKVDLFRSDRGVSTIYNATTGKWLDEFDKPAEVDLRIQLPAALAGCEINEFSFEIQANAQGRKIQFYGFRNSEEVLLYEIENAQGLEAFRVDDTQSLVVDGKGGVRLTIKVTETLQERLEREEGETEDQIATGKGAGAEAFGTREIKEAGITWGIKYINVSAEGKMPE